MIALSAFVLALAASVPLAGDDELLRATGAAIVRHDLRPARCSAGDALEGAPARTVVQVRASVPFPRVDGRARYAGRPQFTIVAVSVRELRSIAWPGMTGRERAAVTTTLAALHHHEAGHVRVAVDEVARLNAQPLTITADAEVYRRTVTRRARAGLAALAEAQRAYDRLTDHGRRQDRAPGVLGGGRTELICSTAPGNRTRADASGGRQQMNAGPPQRAR